MLLLLISNNDKPLTGADFAKINAAFENSLSIFFITMTVMLTAFLLAKMMLGRK